MVVAVGDFPGGRLIAGDVILTPVAGPVGPKGERGEQGPVGPSNNFPAVWVGPGSPPDYVEGSKVGDTWIDSITGIIYELK